MKKNDIYRSCEKGILILSMLLISVPMFGQWTNLGPPASTGQVMDMRFLNKDTGYVAVSEWNLNKGDVYRTVNGGSSWSKIYSMVGSVESVEFKSFNEGFVATGTSDVGYRTSDGGATWTQYSSKLYTYGQIRFRDQNNGFIIGGGSATQGYTLDGGQTWESYPVSRFMAGFIDYESPNSNVAFALDWDGRVYKSTTDTSWVFQSLVPGAKDLFFVDANEGYLITPGQIFATSDGGVNWAQLSTNGGYGIIYADPNTFYIIDGSASIAQSSDGGTTFTQMTGTFNDVSELLVANDVAFAFGSNAYSLGGITTLADKVEGISDLKVFPNPTNGVLRIAVSEPLTRMSYEIRSLTGRLVAAGDLETAQIDLVGFVAGTYILRLQKQKEKLGGTSSSEALFVVY